MAPYGLARDILDKQLVDEIDTKLGRVDGIVLELRDGEPPRIAHFELGFGVLARRIGPRTERFFLALRERLRLDRVGSVARYRIDWRLVYDIKTYQISVRLKFEETPLFAWERWLRDRVVRKLPGETD
jgi:hypothetical protein